ncbi:MAG: hypothetical protein ACRDPG_10490 [Nocardioidaceae bacterium]
MRQRHATDITSLVFGIFFAGWAAVWALDLAGTIDRQQAWYAGPIILIAAGLGGLLAALRPARHALPQNSETGHVERDR